MLELFFSPSYVCFSYYSCMDFSSSSNTFFQNSSNTFFQNSSNTFFQNSKCQSSNLKKQDISLLSSVWIVNFSLRSLLLKLVKTNLIISRKLNSRAICKVCCNKNDPHHVVQCYQSCHFYAKYKKKSGRKSNSKQHKDISSGITHNFPTTLHVNFIT